MLFKTLDHFFTIEAAEGRMVQGEHQKPISQSLGLVPFPLENFSPLLGICKLTYKVRSWAGETFIYLAYFFFHSIKLVYTYYLPDGVLGAGKE